MTPDEYCQQKAAQSGSSFYYSFLFLPPERRRAIVALYAFCREVDDVVDEIRDTGVAQAKLAWWRQEVARVFAGTPEHPVGRALVPVVRDFALPLEHFEAVIDGMAMDLTQTRYLDFAGLELYCHRVAGVVGLMSAEIFGYTDPATRGYARDLGVAFQLTNICRDVGEDARRGRIYLPHEDLARFGVTANALMRAEYTPAFRELMAFEVGRAQQWYERALAQLPPADRAAQRAGLVMAAIYRTLLHEIARDGYLVLDRRTSLTPLRKLWIAWEDGAPVVIIGGGYAGCAAAVTLAEAGVPCVLHEAAPILGGRGRRVVKDGLALDNGQHLLLGAYTATFGLLAKLAPAGAARGYLRRPLALVPFGRGQRDAVSLVVRRAPGRLGLAIGLLTAGGLTWRERMANVAWFRALERRGFERPRGETVAKMLKPLPRNVATRLWEPLCLAALNTPAKSASAQVFANVLRASFAGDGADSDFVVPTTDLTAFLPEAAAAYVQARGGTVHTGRATSIVRAARDGVVLASGDVALHARAAIVATSPHRLGTAFAPEALASQPPLRAALEALEAQPYEPIATVWLGYPARIDLPGPVARLDDAPGQWVIERPDVLAAAGAGAPRLAQLLAVVISAGGPHLATTHDALVRDTDAQLRRLRPDLPPLAWSFAIVEKRATYACTPDRALPAAPRFAPGIYLAGDYAYPDFPATLESAVRSGVAAAQAVLADSKAL